MKRFAIFYIIFFSLAFTVLPFQIGVHVDTQQAHALGLVPDANPKSEDGNPPEQPKSAKANCDENSSELCNPIGTDDLGELINRIGSAVRTLAIPIAVIVIIWAGVQFLISGGNPEKIGTARKALWWAMIGLAIIFIGEGFISLIKDILSLSKQ